MMERDEEPTRARRFLLFRDAVHELRGRWECYTDDWRDGWRSGISILAPAVFIYCASALPALAFGQQLAEYTDGELTVVHVLAATAITGVLQAVVGGQPLLIVGVAEPIVIIYAFMYEFLKSRPDSPPFLAFSAWVCIWTCVMLLVLAALNSGRYILSITRLSAELFGLLISILFLQQAIKGTIAEFRAPTLQPSAEDAAVSSWFNNGMWALFIGMGLLLTSLMTHSARTWALFGPGTRGFLADYGAPLMVVVWSAAGYIASDQLPNQKPRPVLTPNTWDPQTSWTVANRLHEVSAAWVFVALVPAAIITCLFWFDHGVSALMAQQSKFGVQRPTAYNWDLLLLAAMTLACGLLGLPPVNGVLPQAPMHTHTLVTLKAELHRLQARRDRMPPSRSLADLLGHWTKRLGPSLRRRHASTPGLSPTPSARALHLEAPLRSDTASAPVLAGTEQSVQLGMVGIHVDPIARAAFPEGLGCHDGRERQGVAANSEGSALRLGHRAEGLVAGSRGLDGGLGGALDGDGACQSHQRLHDPGDGSRSSSGSAASTSIHRGPRGQGEGRRDSGSDGGSGGGPQGPRLHASVVVAAVTPPSQLTEELRAQENRLSNLLQSLLVGATLAVTPLIRLIPTAVLWGYFAYMALVSLPGNDMWERLVLCLCEACQWDRYKRDKPGLTTGFTLAYTAFQLAWLLGIVGLVTWAGIAGISFPAPILALVPIRTFLLPRVLREEHVQQLQLLDPPDV